MISKTMGARVRWVTALGVLPLSVAVGCGDSQHSGDGGAEEGGEAPTQTGGKESRGGSSAGATTVGGKAGNGGGGVGAGGGVVSVGGGVVAGAGEDAGGAGGAWEEPQGPENEGGAGGEGTVVAEGGAGGQAEEPCGTLEDSLVIATTRVAGAFKGSPYEVSLVPLGGSHTGYVFELASGALPQGLQLDAQGKLHGTTTSLGTFSFSVKLTDSAQHVSTRDFSLVVGSLRRWTPSPSGARTLRLVDGLHPEALPLSLTHELYSSGSYQLSPDGSKLVYEVRLEPTDSEPTSYELYVVRLSDGQPSTPERLDRSKVAYIPFDWSLDSKRLAFATSGVRSADVSQATTKIVEVEPGVAGTPKWLTATTLGYAVSASSFRFSTVSASGFTAPKELPEFSNQAVFQTAGNQIAYPTKTGEQWIDFDSGATKALTGSVQVSPGLSFVAQNSESGNSWQIVPLNAGAALLAGWPESTPSKFVWGDEQTLLATNNRVDIWRRGSTGYNRASLCVDRLKVSYAPFDVRGFSPDGTWLFFAHETGSTFLPQVALSAVGIQSGQVLPPVDVGASLFGRRVDYSVSPDSHWLIVMATPEAALFVQYSLVHLTGEGTHAPQLLSFGNDRPQSLSWAQDSSGVDVLASNGSGRQRYVVNLADAKPTPKPVD